ncbi:hypothetical protein FRC11_005303 [Ceratobasidium sp. 423]|nr:hypothetical protein FRC11_005303 [Ceratobasidium sp. 423]
MAVLNWVLAASLLSQQEYITPDKIFFYGVAPFLTVPLPVFITFDWPRTRPWIYQLWLAGAIWGWAWYNIMFMYFCGNYGQPTNYFKCMERDFLVLFYYVTGLPVIAIFALGQNRTVQTFMVVSFVCTAAALFVPYKATWIRHILNLIIFHAFVLYINWMRETVDRRLYVLRDQLKTQYKQTQKAQISERKSSDSKRRLTSYIFHEVRVPLNTALLAAQNLAGTNAIQREHEIEFNALEGSLNMMSKVLNDVLDFNRMDSGRFETVSKPFAFHAVIRSMLVPLGLGASAKGLQLIVEIDEDIDVQARLAAYRAQVRDVDLTHGEKYVPTETTRRRQEDWVAQRMEEGSEEDGIVMGDEMRLRQVVTNLASNACKFTEPGGRITLRTKLIIPGPESRARLSSEHRTSTDSSHKGDTTHSHGQVHITPPMLRNSSNESDSDRLLEHIVVRIEVQDTGVGFGQRDMEEKRLFSAFMQTSSGLRQGGKGTGLGLALVRHIVALSGGRLGVKSKRAVGSTFWVELPLGVGRKAVAGVHATRARDAAVDAINFSGGWNAEEVARNVEQATRNVDLANRSGEVLSPGIDGTVTTGPTPTQGADASGGGTEDVTPVASGLAGSVEPFVASSSGASTGLGSGLLLAADAPAAPLQSGSALKSIMEHGGVVELVPQLPMQSSHEEGPIVATRTLSPDTVRPSNSPVTSRAAASDAASRLALSDPTASRIVMTEPMRPGLNDSRIGLNDPTASRIVVPADLARASPKPSAHRSMPSESSLPPLKSTAPAPSNGSPVRPTAGSVESSSPLRVLVVDDDSLTRRLMTRMLTRLGCTVENAENGQIALDMLLAPLPTPQSQRTQSSAGFPSPLSASIEQPSPASGAPSGGWEYGDTKYDIVFLDNHMPICSGVEVARRLRQLDRKDFVVGVTGNALTEDQQEYLQAGANHVLTKPVLEKSLKAMLASVDEMHRAQDAELAGHQRANPNPDPRERRHVRPTSHQRTGNAPDPWSPDYQRNTHRFSLGSTASRVPPVGISGNSRPSHPRGPLYAHHRHGSASPDAPVRIRRKSPGIMNFFRKLNGERVRERGHKVPGVWQSLKAIVLSSWLNVLFVFLPFSWVAALAKWNYVYTFILSFIAIIPLENVSEYGGEQLALYCGESIGDLIVITLHNIVEAVLAIILLVKCELKLLQSTVIGVVLLHCLLVPGVAFLTDGTKLWAQQLKPRVTELNQSLLTVGVLALVVPTGFFSALPYQNPAEYAPQFINYTDTMMSRPGTAPTRRDLLSSNLFDLNKRAPIVNATHKASVHAIEVASSIQAVSDTTRDWMLRLSRGISVILLIIYISSRIYLHNPPGEHIVVETVHTTEDDHDDKTHAVLYDDVTPRNSLTHVHTFKKTLRDQHSKDEMEEDRERLISQVEREHGASEFIDESGGEHHHPPELNPWVAVVLLVIVIGLLSVTAEWLVKSIEPIREERLFTSEWFGLILLPFVSFAGDGLNTIMYFIRTNLMKMHMEPPNDLAKAKSIDLSIQFTLFWIPALVLVGWALNEPLTLLFDHFEVVVIVGASFLVNSVTQDGRTNWSEGTIMVGFYIIIGLAAWYYPGDAEAHFLLQCKSMEELLSKPPF